MQHKPQQSQLILTQKPRMDNLLEKNTRVDAWYYAIISTNNLLDPDIHKVIKRIQMLLHQPSHLQFQIIITMIMQAYTLLYTYIDTYVYIQPYTHIYTLHKFAQKKIRTLAGEYTHSNTHTHSYVHINIYIYTFLYLYTWT
jgi:hypothetical protein